jgi:hypothetical protein
VDCAGAVHPVERAKLFLAIFSQSVFVVFAAHHLEISGLMIFLLI